MHVKEDPPGTGRWHTTGPAIPQDSYVSGRIRNERTVCKDSELIHPKGMRRDPLFFIWDFPGLRITLPPGAGILSRLTDLELLLGPRME